jgi:hypothetical protein
MSIHSTGLGDDEVARPSINWRAIGDSLAPVRYAPIPRWLLISGMGRTATYEALGRGDLRAVKLNNRTLIDVEHGLAWLATLPVAQITTGRGRHTQPGEAVP